MPEENNITGSRTGISAFPALFFFSLLGGPTIYGIGKSLTAVMQIILCELIPVGGMSNS